MKYLQRFRLLVESIKKSQDIGKLVLGFFNYAQPFATAFSSVLVLCLSISILCYFKVQLYHIPVGKNLLHYTYLTALVTGYCTDYNFCKETQEDAHMQLKRLGDLSRKKI